MKRRRWPQYQTIVHGRHGCPTLIMVVCADDATTRWAGTPIELDSERGGEQWQIPGVVGVGDPGHLPRADADRSGILSCPDVELLGQWLDRALDAITIEGVFVD